MITLCRCSCSIMHGLQAFNLCFYASILLLCSPENVLVNSSCNMPKITEEQTERFQNQLCAYRTYYIELQKNLQEKINSSEFQEESESYQNDVTNFISTIPHHLELLQKIESISNISLGYEFHESQDALKKILKAPVGFSASSSKTQVPSCPSDPCQESDNIILYDNVDLNIGDMYNKSSGKFTASLPGMYNFYVRCKCKLLSILDECNIVLFKNGFVWRRLLIINKQAMGEMTFAIEMKEHDTVFVKVLRGEVQGTPQDKYTVFQGYRLI